ncbi:MAG: Ig-like domain-containing protein [Duncaniella sp.]|nr:Ig-like domain-containing protein [Duncaniella sp.]
MQRIFTLLLSLVLVSALGWAQATQTVVYEYNDNYRGTMPGSATDNNMLTFPDGSRLEMTGNNTKTFAKGNEITVNGAKKRTIKGSNGVENTFYAPEGWYVSKITLHSYVNVKKADIGSNTYYWEKVGNLTFNTSTCTPMAAGSDGGVDVQTFEFESPLSEVAIKNKGKQTCFVMEVTLVEAGNKIQPVLTWSMDNCDVNIDDETFNLPTLTAEPAENAAEILAGVTYTSSNEKAATIAADGTVTIKGHGTTTITATFEANDNYFNATASYVLHVDAPSVDVEITWPMVNSANEADLTPVVTRGYGYFTASEPVLGSKIDWFEPREVNGVWFNLVQPAEKASKATEGHSLSFQFTVEEGQSFEPTSIEYLASIIGTDGGNYDLECTWGGKTYQIQKNFVPNRNKEEKGWYSSVEEAITATDASGLFDATFHIYNLANNKQIGFAGVTIKGKLYLSKEDLNRPAPEVSHEGDELELGENGTLTVTFNLAEGHKLYYVYTQNEAPAAAEAPQRAITLDGKTYEEAEGNSVTISGAAHLGGTLSYFALDPETGLRSTPVEVSVAPNRVVTGLAEISAEAEAKAEYFTVQGIRVAAPEAAGIYICRRGTEVTKIIVK